MGKFSRLTEELVDKGKVLIDMRQRPTELDRKVYKFVKDVAENGANKKGTKEFIDVWGLEGMELFLRWSQWPEEEVKLKCKKTIKAMEEKYPELKEGNDEKCNGV